MPTHHCKHSAVPRLAAIFPLMLCLFACNAMAQQVCVGNPMSRTLRQLDVLGKEVVKRPSLLKSVQSRIQKLSKKPPKLVGGCKQITSGYFVMEDGSRSLIYHEDGTGTLFLWKTNSENKMVVSVRYILWWDVWQDSRILSDYNCPVEITLLESEKELSLSNIERRITGLTRSGLQTATCGYDGDRLVIDGEQVYVRMPSPNPNR